MGVSGFAGTDAWIWACRKHRSAVTQDAKAAHFLSNAKLQGLKETPTCPMHPMACLTAPWVCLKGARRAVMRAEFQHWRLCHVKVVMGSSLHPRHAKYPHPSFSLPLAGCQVLQIYQLSPRLKLPPSSLCTPLTQRVRGAPLGRVAFPP